MSTAPANATSHAPETGTYQSPDGVAIAWELHRPVGEAKGLVVIAHGVAEHSGRYRHVADALVAAGYAVMIPDHRGHGRSGGARVFVKRFKEYVDDLHGVIGLAKSKVRASKVFLVGHSMGGLIALETVLAYPNAVDGLVLSSPGLGTAIAVPAWKDGLGKIMSKVWPGLAIPTGIPASVVSRDPAVVAAYESDPLVTKKATARWYTEFVAAQADANARALEVKMPLLVLAAGADKLTSTRAIERWFPQVASTDKTLMPYPALYHEVFNEPEKDVVIGDVVRWLDARSA